MKTEKEIREMLEAVENFRYSRRNSRKYMNEGKISKANKICLFQGVFMLNNRFAMTETLRWVLE